ncbi:Ribosomal protein L35 [Nesidiocoris tenuis]|uniref:Large ribosomal subunit protein bL35m n=1 Tax=Nesidiocoris tenuis TaxID=355587 RepID=A0ABN7AWL0_9HEMI|nr:Ribosomal protein L35 [Nesidiocoris tenuis]
MIRSVIGSCLKLRSALSTTMAMTSSVATTTTRQFRIFDANFLKAAALPSQNFCTLSRIQPLTSNLSLMELKPVNYEQKRSLIKYSLHRGKRKTVKAVLKRFYRLDWGIWIRTMCGRHKKMHKKSLARKRRLRRHVFTNATQSWLLDTMVTRYWRRPKYLPDSPYNPYHKREEFFLTRRKPAVPVAS